MAGEERASARPARLPTVHWKQVAPNPLVPTSCRSQDMLSYEKLVATLEMTSKIQKVEYSSDRI
jgi:hypothetical protein